MKIFVKFYLQSVLMKAETFSSVSEPDTGVNCKHITFSAEVLYFICARAVIFHYLFNYNNLHESGSCSAALTQHSASVGSWPV